jgi:hypothetical protein
MAANWMNLYPGEGILTYVESGNPDAVHRLANSLLEIAVALNGCTSQTLMHEEIVIAGCVLSSLGNSEKTA